MREIEIKLSVDDIEGVIKKLEALGCVISPPVFQKDINFIHKDDVNWFKESINTQYSYPRIRVEDEKIILTNKKPVTGEMDCLEYELVVDSIDQARGFISLFDYIEGVAVVKKRRKTHYKNYEITVDEVEDLGSFIEIEIVVEHEADPVQIQNEMFDFAKQNFGLEKNEDVMKGYDIMVYHKKNSR